MPNRNRMTEGVMEAMMRVPNLVGDADQSTAEELAEELTQRGIGPLERRKYASAGPLTMTKSAFQNLAAKVRAEDAREVVIRMSNVDGHPAMIAEIVYEDMRGERWNDKYLVAGDGAVKL